MTQGSPVEMYREEAGELLEVIEQGLLDLEQRPDDAGLINSVFRALHTIKGSGAMFGFTTCAAFVHEFETAFDRVRKGETKATAELIAVALDAADHISKLIVDPAASVPGGEEILAALRSVVGGKGAVAVTATSPTRETKLERQAGAGWRIRFKLPPDALALGTNPQLLFEEMAGLGACEIRASISDVPDLGAIEPEVSYLGWDVILRTDRSREAIEDVFLFLRDGMHLMIEPLSIDKGSNTTPDLASARRDDAFDEPVPQRRAQLTASAGPAPAQAQSTNKSASPDKPGSSLRVPAERLDALMDGVGELVIAQARLSQVAANSTDHNLKAIAEEMERLSSSLRDTTMGIRMVPIGNLFGRFRRLVHDLSHSLGKEIEFITSGEETELDKTVIEQLADPLVHLIRNAVDHGLESAEKRVASGKPPGGTVRLAAAYAGAEVAITITDDGAGLNAERIKAKAIDQGLITADARLSENELFQLILLPGFSTAKEVTSLSGRGVGMDVVKRTIDGLRGSIELASVAGRGTTVTLRLPLTLAIIDGLLVRVGNDRFTIPLAAVEECVELPKLDESGSKGRSFLNIRGGLVPFLALRDMFCAETEPDEHQKVVIISSGEMRVGLVVDQIIGNNQTVIKQLSKLHSSLKTFSGATILGDGAVALILDVMHLVSFGQTLEERHRNASLGRAA